MHFTDCIIPVLIAGVLLWGLSRGVDVFRVFLEGAGEGLKTAVQILPALVLLLTAIAMFRASGSLEVLTHAVRPLAEGLGFPVEVLPLALLRPISGSGALALFEDILRNYGPDGFIGRVASVLQGSTETTFYTIAVYYGAVSVQRTRHTLTASLTADFVGFAASVFAVRLIFGA